MTKSVLIGTIAIAAGLSLAGCTKPTPEVTIWTPATSVATSATCWAPDSTAVEALADCVGNAQNPATEELPSLAVTPGNTVGINVDSELAETGWIPDVGGQPLVAQPMNQSYFRFTMPPGEVPPAGYLLTIRARGSAGDADRGIWLFRLTSSGIA